MSTPAQDQNADRIDQGTTVIKLAKRQNGTWEATQTGLDIVGTGPSAARATEDLAATIADQLETTGGE